MAAEREKWGRQVEFVLTLVGYAVGLGNVWRFPYLCYKNGGGAFLIPYTLSLIFLGIPLFALECAFGQYGGKGPLSIWSINPAFKGLGMSMTIAVAILFIYYDIVIAWSMRYLVASFTSHLPWIDCNDCSCLLYGTKNITNDLIDSLKTNNSLGIVCPNLGNLTVKSPSELYFTNEILRDSGTLEKIGDIQWEILLASFVSYIIIFLVLLKGVASLGKVAYFTAVFPYILLTILLVRCAMLDGAYDGVMYYLTPRWEFLTKASVWSDAAVQIFFSLSACCGGLIAMSSYNNFNNNIIRDAFVVPIINCLTSFYAGFVVFSTLGNMAKTKGVPIDDVTKGGPGLAFIVYPEALGNMPVSTLWSILFFFMLCLLGFSTQFSGGETLMTSIIDEFPSFFTGKMRKRLFRGFACLAGFILGIPMTTQGGSHLMNLVDEALLGFPLLIIGLFEFLVVIYIYGYSNFAADVKAMVGFSPFIYFRATWTVIGPVLLLAVVVFKAYQMPNYTPAWTGLLYYLIVIFCLMWIAVWFFYYTCRRGLWEMMKAEKEWTDRRHLAKTEQTENVNTSHDNPGKDESNVCVIGNVNEDDHKKADKNAEGGDVSDKEDHKEAVKNAAGGDVSHKDDHKEAVKNAEGGDVSHKEDQKAAVKNAEGGDVSHKEDQKAAVKNAEGGDVSHKEDQKAAVKNAAGGDVSDKESDKVTINHFDNPAFIHDDEMVSHTHGQNGEPQGTEKNNITIQL